MAHGATDELDRWLMALTAERRRVGGVILVTKQRAALGALLMWYLMVPPYRLDGDVWVVSMNVPIARWTITARFDPFDKCHEHWAAESIARIEASRKISRTQWSPQQYAEYAALRAFLDGQCVSSSTVNSQRE